MNFEIRAGAVKKLIYMKKFESLEDEELEQISKLPSMTAYRKSTSVLLPRLKPDEIRELLAIEQLKRKRKMFEAEAAEYDPKRKIVEIHPFDEIRRLQQENDDLKQRLELADEKISQVRQIINKTCIDEIEIDDEV